MKIDFDEKVALEVFKKLGEMWKKKKGIFEGVVLPQDRYLNLISRKQEQANFLFYTSLFYYKEFQ